MALGQDIVTARTSVDESLFGPAPAEPSGDVVSTAADNDAALAELQTMMANIA